jgi:hypothetical protein
MPVSADTAATAAFDFVLIDGRRITFTARFISRRDRLRHEALCERMVGLNYDAPEIAPLIEEAIGIGLVGWDRPEPFGFEALSGAMSDRDIAILAQVYPVGIQLAESELGKSASRRVFAPAAFVQPAVGNA